MSVAHKWSPIEDIGDAAALSDGELPALIEVWKDQGGALAAPGAVSKFSEQLNREWAIETGIIERAYTLDRGTTATLIEKGIEASLIPRLSTDRDPEEVAAILQDHLDALDGMFAFIKGDRELTVGYIKELHSALLRHVSTYTVRDPSGNLSERELVKGAYKTQPNSPTRPDGTVHEYCPPEHVASEMDQMVENHRKHIQAHLAPEVQAAWLHHAFTQIHPFADGNGRVARTLASLVFVKNGGFPLVIRREDHARYIDALEKADEGELSPFVRLLVSAERRVLIGALQAVPWPSSSKGESGAATPEEAIAEVRELLANRGSVAPRKWDAVPEIGTAIAKLVDERLNKINNSLNTEIGRFNPEFRFSYSTLTDKPASDALTSVHTAMSALGYELQAQSTNVRELRLDPGRYQIIFSLHGAGRSYRGAAAVVLVLVNSEGIPVSATDDIFQFNYKDQQPAVLNRFRKWLETGLTRALEAWRAQI